MTTNRITVTLPPDLDEAVRAAAGANVSAYAARALRNQLLVDDLDRLAGLPVDEGLAADGAEALELAERRAADRRGRAA